MLPAESLMVTVPPALPEVLLFSAFPPVLPPPPPPPPHPAATRARTATAASGKSLHNFRIPVLSFVDCLSIPITSLIPPCPGVERVLQAVTEQVERQHGEQRSEERRVGKEC